MSENSYAAVLVKNAADEFVGKVPTMGQAPSSQRVVPAELLLFELAERLGMSRARLDEIKVAFKQIVRQHGEQKVLQKSASKRHLHVSSQECGYFSSEQRLLQAGIPEGALIDQF
jgi:hypothetical protein